MSSTLTANIFQNRDFLFSCFLYNGSLRAEMHNFSQHISECVSIHLCQLSPHTNHQCSGHTVYGDPLSHLRNYFYMGTLTFHCKPFLQDHHDFSAK